MAFNSFLGHCFQPTTTYNRVGGRRGLSSTSISNICVMCHKVEETVNHLFLHCEVAATLESFHWEVQPHLVLESVCSWVSTCFMRVGSFCCSVVNLEKKGVIESSEVLAYCLFDYYSRLEDCKLGFA